MSQKETGYREKTCAGAGGLRLSYREYGAPNAAKPPLLCLSGNMSNSRASHNLALRYCPQRLILALDYRGRGRSAYDPDYRNYRPDIYLQDMQLLLEAAHIEQVVIVGTSLGGMLAMALSTVKPEALAGVVLNDIGPELGAEGLQRHALATLKPELPNWRAAAAHLRDLYGYDWPDLSDEQWLHLAKIYFTETADGKLQWDHDPKLQEAMKEATTAGMPDFWPMFHGLKKIPTLALRGARSDLLTQKTFDKMVAAKPDLIRVTVPNRGHTPLLDETECLAALDQFLAQV
jgi:pimeloyl-ACP methyl ester carboxylesterase